MHFAYFEERNDGARKIGQHGIVAMCEVNCRYSRGQVISDFILLAEMKDMFVKLRDFSFLTCIQNILLSRTSKIILHTTF